MTIAEFSWQPALLGGLLIGLAAIILMASIGKIAGISGIFANLLKPQSAMPWQCAFIAGLLISGLVVHWLYQPIVLEITTSGASRR